MLQDEQELARGCRKAERGGEKEERKGENEKSAKIIKIFRTKKLHYILCCEKYNLSKQIKK